MRTRERLLALLGLAAFVTGGAIAYAAIPSSDGTVTACYAKSNGQLRVIDADGGEMCRKSETRLSWNQQEPEGPPGLVGVREAIATTDTIFNTHEGVDLKVAAAKCRPHEVVTGGGYRLFASSRQTLLRLQVVDNLSAHSGDSAPAPDAWSVHVYAPSNIGYWGVDARAVCAKLGG